MKKNTLIKQNQKNDISCYNCSYLKGDINWSCTNKEAIKRRDTRYPNATHCANWQLDKIFKDYMEE
jgi:hypothetical protein